MGRAAPSGKRSQLSTHAKRRGGHFRNYRDDINAGVERVIEEYTTGKIAAHPGCLRKKQERQDAKVASGAEA